MNPKQVEDALQGYVRQIAQTYGYWPEDDHEEYSAWQQISGDDFHLHALKDIHADLLDFWKLLEREAGPNAAAAMNQVDYTFGELGGDLWMSRQRSGFEYDSGDATLDEALDRASEALGEAYVELGDDGMVHHT